MPLYEYRCQQCGARFEHLVRSAVTASASVTASAPPVAPAIVCPRCRSTEVARLLSAFARTAPACAPTPSGGG
jgi:putative FmdB family regulatory protein